MGREPSPYIDVIYMGQSASGKTAVWYVVNKKNGLQDTPGIIKWNGGWRKYVYHSGPAYYDAQCLGQIAEFLDRANAAHKLGEIEPGTATLKDYNVEVTNS